MADNELLQRLLSHDRWATAKMLDACEGLDEASFHRRFEMGWGSLHDTLTHIIDAVENWKEKLAGQPNGARRVSVGQRYSVAQLRAAMQTNYDAFAAEAWRLPLEQTIIHRTGEGVITHMPRAAVVAHVATHSMHHRCQCLNMLRHLGQPIPPSGVAEWMVRYRSESPAS